MKSLFAGLILSSFIGFTAEAAMLLKANSPGCGPYPYEDDAGRIQLLPILKSNTFSQGFLVKLEEDKLGTFLKNWTEFFGKNGETKMVFKTICYGYYDDESSTGANALAYGDQAILVGTKMMKDIRDDLDAFITQRYNHWNPQQQTLIKGLHAGAAREFLLYHEFGHFIQNLHGLQFSGKTAKMKELNADCVGATLFTIDRIRSKKFGQQDFLAGMLYAYALGDDQVHDSKHHGFPAERQEAFAKGMADTVNMRNRGINIMALTSKQIVDSCRTSYR